LVYIWGSLFENEGPEIGDLGDGFVAAGVEGCGEVDLLSYYFSLTLVKIPSMYDFRFNRNESSLEPINGLECNAIVAG
jgi:hypothetical protein